MNATPVSDRKDSPEVEGATANQRSQHWIADFIAILFISVIGLKFTWHAALAGDINLSDECWYALSGYDMSRTGPPPACFSPLYAVWYWLFTDLQPDPATLQIWNWRFLVTSLAVLIYLLTRRAGAAPIVSFLGACWLIASNLMSVWPYPTYFVTLMAGLGCVAVMSIRSTWYQAAVIASLFGISGFVRPEMIVAQLALAGPLLLLLVVAYFRGNVSLRRAAGVSAVSFVPVILLMALFGNPLAGGRSEIAFGQHYSLNKAEAGLIRINPWVNWASIVKEDFGTTCSPSQAFLVNPKAMMWHLNRNLSTAWNSLWELADLNLHGSKARLYLLYLLMITIGLSILVLTRRTIAVEFVHTLRRFAIPLCAIAAIGVPVAISSTLIYPRDHYLFPIVFFAVVLVVLLATPLFQIGSKITSHPVTLATLGIVMLWGVPNVAHRWSIEPLFAWENEINPPFRNRQAIEAIKKAPVTGPVRLIEGALFFRMAFPKADVQYLSIWEIEKFKSFADYIRDRDVNVIVASSEMEACDWIVKDPTYTELRDRPTANFIPWAPGPDKLKLLIRRDALSPLQKEPIAVSNSAR